MDANAVVVLNDTRMTYRAVSSLFAVGQVFNGKLEVYVQVEDPKKLTYRANVRAFYGDGAADYVEFAVGDDWGKYKRFTNLHSAVFWLRSAFVDMTDLVINVPGMEEVTKNFSVPSSAESNAIKQKTKYQRYLDTSNEKLTELEAVKAAEVAAGWNVEANVHPEVYAKHVETLKRITEVERNNAFYASEIAENQTVIDAANA